MNTTMIVVSKTLEDYIELVDESFQRLCDLSSDFIEVIKSDEIIRSSIKEAGGHIYEGMNDLVTLRSEIASIKFVGRPFSTSELMLTVHGISTACSELYGYLPTDFNSNISQEFLSLLNSIRDECNRVYRKLDSFETLRSNRPDASVLMMLWREVNEYLAVIDGSSLVRPSDSKFVTVDEVKAIRNQSLEFLQDLQCFQSLSSSNRLMHSVLKSSNVGHLLDYSVLVTVRNLHNESVRLLESFESPSEGQ